jgi:hypothetical protein
MDAIKAQSHVAAEDAIKAQCHVAAEDVKPAVPAVRERAAAWGVGPGARRRPGVLRGRPAHDRRRDGIRRRIQSSRPRRSDLRAALAPVRGAVRRAAAAVIAFAGAGEGAGNLRLYGDWRAAGRPVEPHAYAEDGHGFALEARGLPCDTWMERYLDWLAAQGF